MAGLHDKATISFLPVGHTKFAPDWCFGLMKQCFRRTKIGNIYDIASCVSLSSAVNVPQLVGSLDEKVFVPMYNWSEFFDDIMMKSALKRISRLHQFRFSAARHGIVYVKESSSAAEREITLVRDDSWQPSPDELPPFVTPNGLSTEHQQYLYEKIREFCPNDKKDIVCPRP